MSVGVLNYLCIVLVLFNFVKDKKKLYQNDGIGIYDILWKILKNTYPIAIGIFLLWVRRDVF